MALALSGLPTDRFFFGGFLPAKEGERRRAIAAAANVPATLVFFEAPHRLVASLVDLADQRDVHFFLSSVKRSSVEHPKTRAKVRANDRLGT